MNIDNKLKEIINERVRALGYELYELSYKKESGDNVLHVIVDADKPINIDDIEIVSNEVSKLLDELDPIKENYFLDVSSLGAEKPIDVAKLDKYQGSYVAIHLSNPYKGENNLEGELLSVTQDEVILKIRNKSRYIDAKLKRNEIDRARLAIKF